MEKSRKVKMLSIVALVLAITGMSLGFAAFSSTLTISSSATVTPNEEDFSISFLGTDENGEFTSSTLIYPLLEDGATGSVATLTGGKSASISNMNVSFTEPGQSVTYAYMSLNTGKYDAYFKSWQFRLLSGMSDVIECVPATNSEVTEELMYNACEDIDIRYQLLSSNENTLMDGYARENFAVAGTSVVNLGRDFVVTPGDYGIMVITIEYAGNGDRADGDFEVKIADIIGEYGTAPLSN